MIHPLQKTGLFPVEMLTDIDFFFLTRFYLISAPDSNLFECKESFIVASVGKFNNVIEMLVLSQCQQSITDRL